MTDDQLLEKARQLDQDALMLIYDTYSTPLYHYAYRQLGDEQSAEDCVAETFTRFLSALKNNKGPKKYLRAYLYRIAHNWISDQFRGNQPVVVDIDEQEEILESEQISIERQIMRSVTAEQLRGMIAQLSPDQRQVIVLKHLEDMSNAEVAEIIGKNVGSVKALNSRALVNLRKLMGAKAHV